MASKGWAGGLPSWRLGWVALVLAWSPALAAAADYRVGQRVLCDGAQIGKFEKGRVIAIHPRPGWPDPFYEVQPDGADPPYKCLARYLKPAEDTPAPPSGPALCQPGAKVEAALGISWYAAVVREAPNAQGRCPVHFLGYGTTYDIAVAPSSLRPPGSGPIVKPDRPLPEPPPGRAAAGDGRMPDGRYACHKISGASLIAVGAVEVRGGKGQFRGGLPEGWTLGGIRLAGTDARGQPLLKVNYRSRSGLGDELDCVPN